MYAAHTYIFSWYVNTILTSTTVSCYEWVSACICSKKNMSLLRAAQVHSIVDFHLRNVCFLGILVENKCVAILSTYVLLNLSETYIFFTFLLGRPLSMTSWSINMVVHTITAVLGKPHTNGCHTIKRRTSCFVPYAYPMAKLTHSQMAQIITKQPHWVDMQNQKHTKQHFWTKRPIMAWRKPLQQHSVRRNRQWWKLCKQCISWPRQILQTTNTRRPWNG